jgi:hypothetical protein
LKKIVRTKLKIIKGYFVDSVGQCVKRTISRDFKVFLEGFDMSSQEKETLMGFEKKSVGSFDFKVKKPFSPNANIFLTDNI